MKQANNQAQANATLAAVTVKSVYTNDIEPKASTATLQASNGKQLTVVYVPKMKKGIIEIDGEEYAISKGEADKLRAWYRSNLNAKQARAERTANIANYTSKATDKARVQAIRNHYATAVERIEASLSRAKRKLQIVDNFLTNANCDAMLDKINAERLAKVEAKQRAEYAKLDEYRKIFNILVKLNKFESVEMAKTAYIKDGVNGIGAELFNTAMALVRLSK